MPFLRPWQVAGIIGFECIARRGPLLVARRGDLLLGGLHRGMALLLWVLLPAYAGLCVGPRSRHSCGHICKRAE